MTRRKISRPWEHADIKLLIAWMRTSSDTRRLLEIYEELKARNTPLAHSLAQEALRRADRIADAGLRSFLAQSEPGQTIGPALRLVGGAPHIARADGAVPSNDKDLGKERNSMEKGAAIIHMSIPGATWRDGSDLWKALCIECRANGVKTEADLTRFLAGIERAYKGSHNGPMPVKYRSAKSVLMKAFRLGVAITDRYGNPLGKSVVERSCKEAGI